MNRSRARCRSVCTSVSLLSLVACGQADARATLVAEAEALARRVVVVPDAGGPGIDQPKAPADDDARCRAFTLAVKALYSDHVMVQEDQRGTATVELLPPTAGIQSVVVFATERLDHSGRLLSEALTLNFDWVEGRVLRLVDLVRDPRHLVELALPTDDTDQAQDESHRDSQSGYGEGSDSGIDEAWWRLTPGGVRFDFPAGYSGPEVEGAKVVELPWQRFADLRTPLGERVWRGRP